MSVEESNSNSSEEKEKDSVPENPLFDDETFEREDQDVSDVRKYADLAIFGSTAEHDDAEAEEDLRNRQRCSGLLHPETGITHLYNQTQMLFLVYLLLVLPYRIAFDIDPPISNAYYWVDVTIDFSIVIDIGLNFYRFFYDKTRKLVTDQKRIQKAYLRSWFLVDFLSVIPFDFIVKLLISTGTTSTKAQSTKLLRLSRIARFARLAKLTKLTKLHECTAALRQFLHNLGISALEFEFLLRILGLVFLMFAIAHIFGCIWLQLGRVNVASNDGWMTKMEPDDLEHLQANLPLCDDPEGDGCNERHLDLYVQSIYFTLVTMSSVGYGDFHPITTGERQYCIITIIVAIFLNAYIIGAFSSIMSNLKYDSQRYDTKMRQITEFLKFIDAPSVVADKVQRFYQYKFLNKTMFDDHKIIDELPARIRTDLVLHRFAGIVENVPFFQGCRQDAVVEICQQLHIMSIMPGDNIIEYGDPFKELVILTRGSARSVPIKEEAMSKSHRRMSMAPGMAGAPSIDKDGNVQKSSSFGRISPRKGVFAPQAVILYPAGSFFGELEFLGFSQVRHVTIEATYYCEVATLHPKDIESILDVHVKLRHRLHRYGTLKLELEKALVDNGTVTEMTVEELKQKIEDGFSDESAEIRDEFAKVDKEGQGFLLESEFLKLIVALGAKPPSPQQLTDLMLQITDHDDENHVGQVHVDAFIAWWNESDGLFTDADSGRHIKVEDALLSILSKLDVMNERLSKLEEKSS